MKKTLLLFSLVILFSFSGCGSPRYQSDAFEPRSIEAHLSAKSRESIDSSPLYFTKQNSSAKRMPIWEVSGIEVECVYNEREDHVDIEELYVFDRNGNEGCLSEISFAEVTVEWWPISEDEIYVDDVFFLGEDGFYIFHIRREYPAK